MSVLTENLIPEDFRPDIPPMITPPTESPLLEKRELARLVRPHEFKPHPNADRLDLARVDGWICVVKREEREIQNQRCWVYIEIDSVLPTEAEWVQKLALKSPIVRTMKIRDVVSQGLLMPLEDVLPVDQWPSPLPNIGETVNVTDLLKIAKRPDTADVEPSGSENLAWTRILVGPHKTDEPRIQSHGALLEELKGKPYVVTEKVDGSSLTVGIDNGALIVCSRNYVVEKVPSPKDRQLPIYWQLAIKNDLEVKLLARPHLVLQGEAYGPKVQKNRLNVTSPTLAIFNIFDLRTQVYLNYDDMVALCAEMELPLAKLIERGDCFDRDLDSLVTLSKGCYTGTKNAREGIVIRPSHETVVAHGKMAGDRLSFKMINPDYLLETKQ